MEHIKCWYDNRTRFREERAVVKLNDKQGNFAKSIMMPTSLYPLNGPYQVFHCKNTKIVTDEKILEIFDSVKYKIGFCYTNTQNLVKALKAAGYEAKSFVGWLFTGVSELPVHHCWVIVNENQVLDLSDDFSVMLGGENGKNFQKAKTKLEQAELIASFQKEARNYKNSQRCFPVGMPTPFLLYIGAECDPVEGKLIYNRLIAQYPDHECQRNCDETGLNATQRVIKERGLM